MQKATNGSAYVAKPQASNLKGLNHMTTHQILVLVVSNVVVF